MSISDPSAAQTPLLDDTVDGCLDYKGRPVRRSSSGCWRSASFIIVVEIAERFAYYGISSNLITYLTGPLGESTATAAAQVNAWNGAASLLPLLGAFIADSFLGRYRTIILASLVYVLGIGLLALSATLSSISSSGGQNADDIALSSSLQFQVILFFFSLYLVAFAQGGHKPCVQAFGADQFDTQDAEECKAKSSFFNWWYFGEPAGITLLQRIGSGMVISTISLVIAAVVEMRRLKIAEEHGLIDKPIVVVPMSISWLVPQYALYGLADVFTMVGLQEFFYDQMPNELRSVGLALYLSIFGVGSFLSSFLISAIENLTSRDGRDSWFANNLNRAHLDYFYLLLAALSAVGLTLYVCCTKYYIYARWGRTF
ncbi:hypothetical protein V6Z12_A02G109500 [Gossypium hirsutum]